MRISTLLLALSFLLLLVQSACSSANGVTEPGDGEFRVFYVSPTGDNNNLGTRDKPWATPGYGARQLRAGDTLVILAGRYILSRHDEDIIAPQNSGTPQAWITIKGEENNRPVLAGRNDLLVAIDISGRSYIRIENLEITSDNNAPFRNGIQALGNSIRNVEIRNVHIHHLDEFGINIEDVDGLLIEKATITHCGFGAIGGPAGDEGGWRNVRIVECELSYSGHYYQGTSGPSPYERPDGFGIEDSEGPIEISHTRVEHNRGDGLDCKSANTYIHHCIVANNSCDGIKLWFTNSKVENTLVYGRGDGDFSETPWSAIVISTESSGAEFEIVNVTVDDIVGKNYLMYAQYDHPNVPIKLTLRNNVFRGAGPSSPIFLSARAHLTAEHNLSYTPSSVYVLEWGDQTYDETNITTLGSGNLYGDPLFVRPACSSEGDYHLRDRSPAINRGTPTNAPCDDLEGGRGPQRSGYDMVCYEK